VVVVGDVNPKAVVKSVNEYFGKIPRGQQAPPLVATVEPVQVGERRVSVVRQAQTPLMIIAYHGCRAGEYDEAVLDLLSGILSDGESSRLYQSLIYRQKLALYAELYNVSRTDPGLIGFYAAPIAGRTTAELEQALYAELELVKTQGVTADELAKAKKQLKAQYIFSRQNNYVLGNQLGSAASRHDWRDVNNYLNHLDRIKAEDIKQAAVKYLAPENRTVATLVPQVLKGQEK
jgi:zinc protease